MASANQYPPVASPPQAPVPPPYRYRRSIAGPIVLITIGALFLARNLGWHFPIWRWFGHWWPLLLILWGLIVLFERMSSDRTYRRRGIGAGGVLLLIFIVTLGVIAHESSNYNWGNVRDQMEMDDDLGGFFGGGTAYNFDDTMQQAFPAHGTLRVVSDRGAVNITAGDGDMIHVAIHKKLYASDEKEANTYNATTKPLLTVSGDSVLLNANTNGAGKHNVQADMDIEVPAGAAVEIAGQHGDVTVSERKAGVKIALQHGDVALTGITGPVNIALDKGSIRAEQVAGDIDITGHVDDVNLEDVAGAVHLNGDFYEEVRLNKIAKTVIFKTSRSDMEIASVPGELDISSDEVRGNDLSGPSRVVTGSKNIHLEEVAGDLQVQSGNGEVEVTTAEKQPATQMSVATDNGSVNLTFSGNKTPSKVNVTTKHGSVELALAADSGFQISANTRTGGITTDFAGVKISQSDGASQASGTVGHGASKLQVSTDSGDIRIVKS